jgi:hypothetical protein
MKALSRTVALGSYGAVVLATLLAVPSAFAQGTLYTWHGKSSLFQASFQITSEESQPGEYFYSTTFLNSIAVVCPDVSIEYSDEPSLGQNFAYGTTGPF